MMGGLSSVLVCDERLRSRGDSAVYPAFIVERGRLPSPQRRFGFLYLVCGAFFVPGQKYRPLSPTERHGNLRLLVHGLLNKPYIS